jgi:hypothetical protein
MTAFTKTGNAMFVGSLVIIPEPQEDDTWEYGMVTHVDDITDKGTIMFMDDDYVEHEIEIERVETYQG